MIINLTTVLVMIPFLMVAVYFFPLSVIAVLVMIPFLMVAVYFFPLSALTLAVVTIIVWAVGVYLQHESAKGH